MIDTTQLITGLIAVALASIAVLTITIIAPRVKAIWQPFTQSYPAEADFLERQATIGVAAAEKWVEGPGSEKLSYALDYVQSQAQRYGYTFDKSAVRTMIEAKVKELEIATSAALQGSPELSKG